MVGDHAGALAWRSARRMPSVAVLNSQGVAVRTKFLVSVAVLAAATAAATLVVASALGRSGHLTSAHHGRSVATARTHHFKASPNWQRRLRHRTAKRSRARAHAGARARIAVIQAPSLSSYSNGFETNKNGWCDGTYGACDGVPANWGTLDREPNGYSNYGQYAHFIDSATGNWHARAAGTENNSTNSA